MFYTMAPLCLYRMWKLVHVDFGEQLTVRVCHIMIDNDNITSVSCYLHFILAWDPTLNVAIPAVISTKRTSFISMWYNIQILWMVVNWNSLICNAWRKAFEWKFIRNLSYAMLEEKPLNGSSLEISHMQCLKKSLWMAVH